MKVVVMTIIAVLMFAGCAKKEAVPAPQQKEHKKECKCITQNGEEFCTCRKTSYENSEYERKELDRAYDRMFEFLEKEE